MADKILAPDEEQRRRIGDSLKKFRNEAGLTQEEVAQKLGILQQTWYKYESGKNMPSVVFIVNLADAFHVSTDYLLGRTDKPAPEVVVPVDDEVTKAAIALVSALRRESKTMEAI